MNCRIYKKHDELTRKGRLAEAEERWKNATISDIIAVKRREADSIGASAIGSFKAGEDWDERPFTESDLESALDLAETKRKEADRLEAALKREKTAIEADALTVGGIVEAERKRERGDCAKLREALNRLVIASEGFLKTHSAKYYVDTTEALDKAKAALSTPPRNCDRFATVDEARKAHEEYRGDYIMRASNKFDLPMKFEAWLFAPATEKEGGDDGK